MEFLVEFGIHVPEGTPEAEVEQRMNAEAAASAKLTREGRLVPLWRPPAAPGERKALGLYRADSEAQLDDLLGALPLSSWMQISVTRLEPHPNDPPSGSRTRLPQLPVPHLTLIYRLDATLGEALDLGDFRQGHRRIVPLTSGTFTGPELSGKLVPGASADWQTVLPDDTALGEAPARRICPHPGTRVACRRRRHPQDVTMTS